MSDRVVIQSAVFTCAVFLTLLLATSFASSRVRGEQQRAAIVDPPPPDPGVEDVVVWEAQPVITTRSSR